MLALDVDEGWGTQVGSGSKADKNSLDIRKSLLGAGKKVSGPIEPLGDDNARVMWPRLTSTIEGLYPSMSHRFGAWHSMSLAFSQVYRATSMLDGEVAAGWWANAHLSS
jgi:hypothetical protein